MKIIIVGAGRVGESVAESLCGERNDITVIDSDAVRLRALEERLDLRGVLGNGTEPSVLDQAGAPDADMLIACAALDETNLVASKVAKAQFRVPTTVARLRSADFVPGGELLGPDGFAVDHVICPENSVMNAIDELIKYPEALQVLHFSRRRASLVAVRVALGSTLASHTIGEFRGLFPSAEMRVVAIYRGGRELASTSDTRILAGDELFVLAAREQLRDVLVALHKQDRPVQRIMIAGGGRVGFRLAKHLASTCAIKLIEADKQRCEYLAESLPSHVLVLRGDGTDEALLQEENVGEMDLFLSITSDDEDNIMAAMLAKRLGVPRVMALINRRAYADIMEGSAIDIAISPAQAVIGELLTHVRRGDVVAVHSLRRGAAEVIEAVVRGDAKTSQLAGRRVEEIKLPKGASLGAIVRGEGEHVQVMMPHHDTLIESADHVIIFIPNKRLVRDVERLFQVSATFF
jgi:trk system potassium uptake protein